MAIMSLPHQSLCHWFLLPTISHTEWLITAWVDFLMILEVTCREALTNFFVPSLTMLKSRCHRAGSLLDALRRPQLWGLILCRVVGVLSSCGSYQMKVSFRCHSGSLAGSPSSIVKQLMEGCFTVTWHVLSPPPPPRVYSLHLFLKPLTLFWVCQIGCNFY